MITKSFHLLHGLCSAYPARRMDDDSYKRIDGFASCFECKATYSYQSGGTGSTKHLLKHVCSKTLSS